jgi:hypothetical protein
MNDKLVCENEWWKFHYNRNVLKDLLLRPKETRVFRENLPYPIVIGFVAGRRPRYSRASFNIKT